MIRRVLGLIILAYAVLMTLWIGYNLLIERLPATKDLPVLPGLVVTACCYLVGWKWLLGKPVDTNAGISDDRDDD